MRSREIVEVETLTNIEQADIVITVRTLHQRRGTRRDMSTKAGPKLVDFDVA